MSIQTLAGEVLWQVHGESYAFKPTFKALLAIETEANTALLVLARQALEGALPLQYAALILKHCAQNPKQDVDALCELYGVAGLMPVVHAIIQTALAGTVALDDDTPAI